MKKTKEVRKEIKKPASQDLIFKTMMQITFAVAAIFLLKNLIGKTFSAAIMIGVGLLVFSLAVFVMKKFKVGKKQQQLIICIFIALLVFMISLNSGDFYSDDFLLYLAVIGLSGLYLRPSYALVEMVVMDILLILQYFIHPEKADPPAQFIMCLVIFSVAAYTFYLTIKRGRAYIKIGQERAEDAEKLLQSLKNAGEGLQKSCEHSGSRIIGLQEANERLESSADELRQGSEEITVGTKEVAQTFEEVQIRMQTTESQIDALNAEVKKVEDSLADSKESMIHMTKQIESVKDTVAATSTVFALLQKQIQEITEVTDQLHKIASSTNMLALNASIEAARAGHMGSGFAVVASKVQELAEDSNRCNTQVVGVVTAMQEHIAQTTSQLSESTHAINLSIESLAGFQESFDTLTEQFSSLYHNIEEQNSNVHQMDAIIGDMKTKISEMTASSEENQNTVLSISDAITVYKDNMELVIEDTKNIQDVSESMLELSQNQHVDKVDAEA